MTTKNPRLTITLKPSLAAQLREMARLTGNSQSSLIAQLLEGSQVVFDRLIKVMQAAEAAKQSLKGRFTGEVASAQAKIEAQMGLSLEALDDLTQPILDGFEDIKRRAGRAAERGPTRGERGSTSGVVTPPSNRGVRFNTKHIKTGAPSSIPVKQKHTNHGGGRHGAV